MSEQNDVKLNRAKLYQLVLFPMNNGATNVYYILTLNFIAYYANADIAVLRNGKAKKNDPPIPDDLAPISGSKRQKKREPSFSEEPRFLDPIRFRYSEEAVAEEPEKAPETTAEETASVKETNRNNRHRRGRRRPGSAPKEANAEVQETADKPQATKADAPAKKRRRPPYRRHSKPKQEG